MPATRSKRCSWAGDDPLYIAYHDEEWGNPEFDDGKLFEMLLLEGAQAGLAWITILRKREGYRKAFAGFDPKKIARFDSRKIERLLQDPGIVRNRLKVEAAVGNAKASLDLRKEGSSLAEFLWSFVDGRPIQNAWKTTADNPAETDASKAMSKALKKRGFRFVGPTICYALMQATGMVNDHVVGCPRHREVKRLAPPRSRA